MDFEFRPVPTMELCGSLRKDIIVEEGAVRHDDHPETT